MSTVITRFATKEPTACGVCRRRAVWLGYAPTRRDAVIWLCDDDRRHAAAKRIYAMPTPTLDAYEIGAMLEAGAQAGRYLDEVGKTDLSSLSAGEWSTFLRRIVTGYEQALRRKILNNEVPF
jgi:Family of unknown function (DUF6511)